MNHLDFPAPYKAGFCWWWWCHCFKTCNALQSYLNLHAKTKLTCTTLTQTICFYSTNQKFGHINSCIGFSLYFLFILTISTIVKAINGLMEHIWNNGVNLKVLKSKSRQHLPSCQLCRLLVLF